MGLPSCFKQRAKDRAPQLGAGDPLGIGERQSLSDKELKTVIDDPIEYGSAIVFKHNRRHPLV